MGKYVFLIFASIALVACGRQDETYYRQNPQALQQAVQNCPNKKPADISCAQLVNIAREVNELAYQLQTSPQGFGKSILELQENIAQQQAALQSNPNQPELKSSIEKNKQNLALRLAIVKWLESPES
ncbi:secreted endonuclease [Legionella lansingensis]|uniref:Secreted endonuclease n=1 Tax=Legionella lansingensis TaxID=45067 RepID=A0A0W0VT80_9GAMM|nr:hypothetical protein [Legionella lansingensis]KTD23399.1 secreted endonuclease [Legionella lansingensis]SNV49536.1 secreted endonuclease [Legionella lansingensis]